MKIWDSVYVYVNNKLLEITENVKKKCFNNIALIYPSYPLISKVIRSLPKCKTFFQQAQSRLTIVQFQNKCHGSVVLTQSAKKCPCQKQGRVETGFQTSFKSDTQRQLQFKSMLQIVIDQIASCELNQAMFFISIRAPQ